MCVLSIIVPIGKKSGNLFNDPRIWFKGNHLVGHSILFATTSRMLRHFYCFFFIGLCPYYRNTRINNTHKEFFIFSKCSLMCFSCVCECPDWITHVVLGICAVYFSPLILGWDYLDSVRLTLTLKTVDD